MTDFAMLLRHQQMGCEVVVVRSGNQLTGYVFRRYRIRAGRLPLPAMFVIHAPDRDELIRIAGNLGRHFLSRAAPFLVMDADSPVAGLLGLYTELRGGTSISRVPAAPRSATSPIRNMQCLEF